MPRIHYLPDDKEVEAGADETLLQTSLRSGILHANACGGNARCSTCRVVVLEGLELCEPRTPAESKLAEQLGFAPDMRLACQTRVRGDVKLRRPVLDAVDIELTSQLRKTSGGPAGPVGEEKSIAILFADIAQYTPFAEALPPYDIIHVLNRYFYLMGRVITGNGGTISDYVGDGLMAVFGVDGAPDPAFRAVKAGVEMLRAVEEMNPYLRAMSGRGFSIRIGVHYGEVVVGTIGIAGMTKVAAIGDPVNLASRIETANKQTGTELLISDETRLEIGDRIPVARSFRLPLKGKTGEHTLWEVKGDIPL